MSDNDKIMCVNHPKVETYLRCNRCGDPICPRCAVRTDVGYRCPQCVNQQQRVFYAEFRPIYYVVAALVALPLSLIAGFIIPNLGWFTIFLAPLAGTGIAEATRWAIGKRRGRYVWLVVCGSIVVGVLPELLLTLFTFFSLTETMTPDVGGAMYFVMGGGIGLLWNAIYLVAAVGTAYARFAINRRR